MMPKLDDASVRALAGNHGYEVERAIMKGCWRLVDEKGKRIRNPATDSTAFTLPELVAFLKSPPD
jgi:hypothetical protein